MSIYQTMSLAELTARVMNYRNSVPGFNENKLLVEFGDHWQNGNGWAGPRGTPEVWAAIKERVHTQFTVVDAVGEALERHVQALTQREPSVEFAPVNDVDPETPEGQKVLEEAAAIRDTLSQWWDRVRLWDLTRIAVRRSRWAGHGNLRLFVTPTKLVAGSDGTFTLPTNLSLAEALDVLSLSSEMPDVACVLIDHVTGERAAFFNYLDLITGKQRAELWFVDEATGDSVMRNLAVDATPAEQESEYRIPMGGVLPIAQMEATLLVTPALRQQQARLNFIETTLTRVVETAGFAERYTTNAAPNGEWLTAVPRGPSMGEKTENGVKYYLHPAPRTLGAGMTTDLRGVKVDEKGTIATPGVTFKEPSDPSGTITAATHARATVLRSCHQGHVAVDSNTHVSGLAYVQARADFEADLTAVKSQVEAMLRDLLTAVVGMTQAMGAPAVLDRFRPVVDLYASAGPVTPDEQKTIGEQVKDGLMSRETAMSRSGIEDVAAELGRIDASEEAKLSLKTSQLTALSLAGTLNLNLEAVAEFLGIDPVAARQMTRTDLVTGVTQ
jgi:hypothetical protein